MTVNIAQLDAAIQQLTEAQTQLVADIQTLLVKLPTNPDYTNELNAVQASIAALQGADTSVKAALPVDVPTESPSSDATPVEQAPEA